MRERGVAESAIEQLKRDRSARYTALLESRDEAVTKPVVVRLDGNNAELGRQILVDAALPGLEQVDTMDGAAARAAELASQPAA